MILPVFLLSSNPFFDAYIQSDFLGKLIFLGLFSISILSWAILIHKCLVIYRVKASSLSFKKVFEQSMHHPLGIEGTFSTPQEYPNAYYLLYQSLKKYTLEILNKNRRSFQQGTSKDISIHDSSETTYSYLSKSDVHLIESQLESTISTNTKQLEKNLFILSTIVSLAPFLGLLGTVWGILTSFSHLQNSAACGTNQFVLGGLSLALTTTVLGLVNAIPALIGYNYLKNAIRDFETEMESFANEILAAVELQYRKVDVN